MNRLDRIVTLRDVEWAVNEKIDQYKEWLARKIITPGEFEDLIRAVQGVKTLLEFQSKLPIRNTVETTEKDTNGAA